MEKRSLYPPQPETRKPKRPGRKTWIPVVEGVKRAIWKTRDVDGKTIKIPVRVESYFPKAGDLGDIDRVRVVSRKSSRGVLIPSLIPAAEVFYRRSSRQPKEPRGGQSPNSAQEEIQAFQRRLSRRGNLATILEVFSQADRVEGN